MVIYVPGAPGPIIGKELWPLAKRAVGYTFFPQPLRYLLKNGPKVKLYTGKMYVREILKNFILSQRARKAYYLYSGIATHVCSRKELKETR